MPTMTITNEQRGGLYELVRNHLGGIGDVWIALEQNRDFATAERLGLEFGEDFQLLEDIGWHPRESRESFELTMPPHDLAELLKRLHDEAEMSAKRRAGKRRCHRRSRRSGPVAS